MKKIIGITLIGFGVSIGLYFGLWVCFFGGIIEIVDQIKGNVEAVSIAWGIVKIVFSSFIGTVFGLIFAVPGFVLVTD